MIETRVLLTPVLCALSREGEAVTYLHESEALLVAHPDAGKLPDWHDEAA